MRHGYYLAATGEMLGDVELAKEARDLWHSLVLPAPTPTATRKRLDRRHWLRRRIARRRLEKQRAPATNRFEGVSIAVSDTGERRVLCTRVEGTNPVARVL